MKYYEGMIDSVLDQVGESGGGKDIIYRCPFCEGSKGSGHLYISYDKNMYHCYKCGIGGRDIKNLLTMLGISVDEEIPTAISSRKSSTLKLFEIINVNKKEDDVRDLTLVTEFFDTHTISLTPSSKDYLLKRGLTEEEINVYNIKEGVNRRGTFIRNVKGQDYSGRIMVPSMIGNKVSYFVARDYLGVSDRKYLNPPSSIAYSSEDVWNLDLARRSSSTVIICEGVFTAIAAGRGKYNAVATYGKSIADVSNRDTGGKLSQGAQLLNAKFDRYIVAYDADATKELLSTCEYLSARGADTYFIKVPPIYGPHTDISDLKRDEYLELLKNMKKYNNQSQLELLY